MRYGSELGKRKWGGHTIMRGIKEIRPTPDILHEVSAWSDLLVLAVSQTLLYAQRLAPCQAFQ